MIKKLHLQTHVTALCIVKPHFLLEGIFAVHRTTSAYGFSNNVQVVADF